MSNPNERTTHNREVRQEFYNDASGNTYSNVTRTSETVNNSTDDRTTNSYSNGYVQGKISERRYQENALAQRDNNNAARGLLLGIIFTSVAALAAGYAWLFNQTNEAPTSVTPTIIVPNSPPDKKPTPEVDRPPQKETIIERTKELVPVPQQPAASPTPKQDINITVPNSAPQQPPAEQAPTTQTTTPPQNQSSNTDSQTQKTDTDATTPANGTSDPADITTDSTASTDTNNTSNSAQ